jgi:hypothetical protein
MRTAFMGVRILSKQLLFEGVKKLSSKEGFFHVSFY